MNIKKILISGQLLAVDADTGALVVDISALTPSRNADLANVVLNNDIVHLVPLTDIGFSARVIEIRADGDFQWSTESNPVQGIGPWIDGSTRTFIPVSGATSLKLIRKTNAGSTVNVYLKALGV
jgi:hypothetical protein